MIQHVLLLQYIVLLLFHWVGDFILQTDWQATNKSKNNWALSQHVATYTFVLLIWSWGMVLMLQFTLLGCLIFVVVNSVLHFITDWCTSRWTSKLWAAGDRHNFFVVVGLDQLIHQVTLAITLMYLIK